jgi:putative transposase
MIEETITKTITCKNCGSTACVKFGTYKGNQRYYCKSCQRKFKSDDSSFHGKVQAKYVSQALAEFYTGDSVHDISENLYQQYKYKPSKSIIWKWINKYTDLAVNQFKDDKPEVGNVWTADETMVDLDKGLKVWVYNVIDERTRYLLASRVAISRTTNDAQAVMHEAQRRAGKTPTKVLTDANRAYDDGLEIAFGSETEHVKTKPFTAGDNTQRVERYHGTFKERVKVMRAFKDVETLIQFNDGWVTFYNYFKPHESLNGKTPAEQANIKYDVKNWADLAQVPTSKQTEIESHKLPKVRIITEKVNTERAFKRHRITSRLPRLTPKRPRITDLGAGIIRDRRGQHLRLS